MMVIGLEDVDETTEILLKKLRERPKIETCDDSLLGDGRLWCEKRNRPLVGNYCEGCFFYNNELLEGRR